MKRDTRIQHLGEESAGSHGAVVPPVYRSALFRFADVAALEAALDGKSDAFLYSRVSNPTVRLLEQRIADLEQAADAVAYSSGMAAVTAVLLAHVGSGDHLIVSSRAYAPTLMFVRRLEEQFGVSVTRVEPRDASNLDQHVRENTRLIYMESPASLTFEVTDLDAVANVARSRGITTCADNSWATPLYHRPLERGIDLSLHSGTKYIGGHSDILLGMLAGSREAIARVREVSILLGASLAAEDASLALRSVRTLPLRMHRHEQSAMKIARRLLAHPKVVDVFHPAFCSFPSHDLWVRQFSGSSGLFSFLLDGDARRFCDALRLFFLGVSWGGPESLALPVGVAAAEKERADLPGNLIRLSIGLEDPADLWNDLERGFHSLGR